MRKGEEEWKDEDDWKRRGGEEKWKQKKNWKEKKRIR